MPLPMLPLYIWMLFMFVGNSMGTDQSVQGDMDPKILVAWLGVFIGAGLMCLGLLIISNRRR